MGKSSLHENQVSAYDGKSYFGPTLKQEEWKLFRENNWNKNAKIIDLKSQIPLATENDIFDSLLIASHKYRNEGKFSDLKMYINGRQLVQELKSNLPIEQDNNFEGYITRLDKLTNNAEFIIYVNNFQTYNWPLYVRIKNFIEMLLDEIKITPSAIEIELFAGRYTRTPGGIHKDGCTNLHCVINGIKKFYIWPSHLLANDEIVIKQKYSGEEEYLDSADIQWEATNRIDFTAEPGEIIYCPHNWWHIGHAPQFCLCINIAIYTEDLAAPLMENAFKRLIQTASHPNSQNLDIEMKLRHLSEKLISGIVSNELQDSISIDKLMKITSSGLLPPSPIPASFTLSDSLQLSYNESSKLLYKILDEKIIYSANGIAHSLPLDLVYIELFKEIKKVSRCSYGNLKSECIKHLKHIANFEDFTYQTDNLITNLINMRSLFPF